MSQIPHNSNPKSELASPAVGPRLGRVVFITPSFSAGGAERVTVLFANGVAEAGEDVHLVALSAEGPLRGSLDAKLPLRDLNRPRVRNAIPGLIRELRRYAPASVVVSAPHVAWALLALKPLLPSSSQIVLRTANLPSLKLPMTRSPRLFALLNRLLVPRADLNVATSLRMADELIDLGVRPCAVTVVPNPVDEASIREAAVPPRRLEGPGRRFVAVGRLVYQKGFDRLIDIVKHLPEEDLCLVIGDGPLRSDLHSRARNAGVGERLRFMGFSDNPWAWMSGSDTLLMPSRTEGMPNVALEALACGTPVIATPESGGITEIAALAPDGAVTVSPIEQFVKSLSCLPAGVPASPRQSLLPNDFLAPNAVAAFSAALAELGANASTR